MPKPRKRCVGSYPWSHVVARSRKFAEEWFRDGDGVPLVTVSGDLAREGAEVAWRIGFQAGREFQRHRPREGGKVMPRPAKVEFKFDERSLVPVSKLREILKAEGLKFQEVPIGDRVLIVTVGPKREQPERIGRSVRNRRKMRRA